MIWAWMETSRADTGSSATMNSGETASARARPTRWRWPPDRAWGRRARWSADIETISRSSAIRSRRSTAFSHSPWMRSGSLRIASTVMFGLSEP